jgi:AcrR family transcriptional regulator
MVGSTSANTPAEPQATTRRYAKRLPREVRREQILDAALRLIAREGWAGMTMERIAAEAEIAKSVLYAVFGSQEGLQSVLMHREQERGFAVAANAIAAGRAADDPLSAAAAALVVFLDDVAAEPDTWRVILLPIDGLPDSVRTAIADGRERWRRELEPLAAELLTEAGVDELDPELIAHVARGNAEYLARLLLEQPDRFTPERLAGFAASLFSLLR